jgi:DNA methylase
MTAQAGQPASTAKRKSPSGVATTDVTLSAHVGSNADVFPLVLDLHVPVGSRVADVTWGKGAFWRKVPPGAYQVLGTDLQAGVDCRELPYPDGELDCVILDPPYMEGLFRRTEGHLAGAGTHAAFRDNYSNGAPTPTSIGGPRYHEAVLDLYLRAGVEARRVLRNHGVFIVKCQDEVSANRQRLTHVELINAYTEAGFYCKDLFIVVRPNRPVVTRLLRQEHARKNHSYFLVFVKLDPRHPKRLRAPVSCRG